ncbi:hypothetical protein F8388_013797 [Cannabis sativa]|uniref:Uncharacterized protein n=1 Tax=Cannabis sativa TaxID=3483 RepID=A0A7J6H627_CANSA|nr:hypothetical protein F8388_013797 [Cannabis sativa]KAF4390361.1 hypothetical protein G4B88_024367 [Cannabis sativa]
MSLSSNTSCEGVGSENKLVRIKSHLVKSEIGDKEISVVATCASSDDTIGPVTLIPYSNSMKFKFKTNVFGETVFRCTFKIDGTEHKVKAIRFRTRICVLGRIRNFRLARRFDIGLMVPIVNPMVLIILNFIMTRWVRYRARYQQKFQELEKAELKVVDLRQKLPSHSHTIESN